MRVSLLQHCAALSLVMVDIFLRAIRTRILLPITFSRALTINTCGDALAAVTPGRVGGDPVRYLGFRRTGSPGPAILALFGMEITADAVVLVGVAILLSFVFRPAEHAFVLSSMRLMKSRSAWLVVGMAVAVAVGSIALTWRLMPRAILSLLVSLRESWRCARSQSPKVLALATVLTFVSLIARVAILPVLLATAPGLDAGTLTIGSAVLVYGQLLAPTPAGIGAVEIGAVVGFAGRLPPGTLPEMILLWRAYTLAIGALAGTALLLRETMPRWLSTRVPSVSPLTQERGL